MCANPQLNSIFNSFVQYFGKTIENIRSNFPSVPIKVHNIEPKDVNCPLSCLATSHSEWG